MAARLLYPAPKRVVTLRPNKGLYLDRSSVFAPEGGVTQIENLRVRDGNITNERMGYTKLVTAGLALPDPITHVDPFETRTGTSYLLVGTRRDIAKYVAGSPVGGVETLLELYSTGTMSVPSSFGSTTITGVGTAWLTNAKVGDFIFLGAANRRDLSDVSTSSKWLEITAVTDDTHIDVDYFGGAWIAGSAYTIRKTLEMTNGDVWSSATFPNAQPANEDTWYAVNGSEMMKWNGVATAVTYLVDGVDLPFLARHVQVYKNQLLWGDLTVGGIRDSVSIANSDAGKPEVMNEGIASQFAAVEGTDPIIKMEKLGDQLVVFGDRSTNMIEYVGDPVGYTIRTALDKIGPFASKLVVNHGDYIEFVSDDRAYRFDGIGKAEFGSQVFRDVLRSSDASRAWQSFAYRDTEEGEVHFVIARTTDTIDTNVDDIAWPELSIVEHYVEPVAAKDPTPFTLRRIGATAMGAFQRSGGSQWDEHLEAFSENTARFDDRAFTDDAPILVYGTATGLLRQLNVGQTFDGDPMTSYALFSRRASIDGEYKGMLRTLRPWLVTQAAATASVDFTVYMYDEAEGASPVKQQTKTYPLDKSGPLRVPFRVAGRYQELMASITSTGDVATLSGWEMEFVPLGRR